MLYYFYLGFADGNRIVGSIDMFHFAWIIKRISLQVGIVIAGPCNHNYEMQSKQWFQVWTWRTSTKKSDCCFIIFISALRMEIVLLGQLTCSFLLELFLYWFTLVLILESYWKLKLPYFHVSIALLLNSNS